MKFADFDAGIAAEFVARFEGFVDHTYRDCIGLKTIGYGHQDDNLADDQTITTAAAALLLAGDLRKHQRGLAPYVTADCNVNQFVALLSIAYNCGVGNIAKSTLLRFFNSGKVDCAADQFLRWNRAGGKVVAGLTRRREAERDLFLKG